MLLDHLLRRGSNIVLRRAAMAGNEGGGIDPAAGVVAIAGTDEWRGELAHFKVQVSPVFSASRSYRGDLLAAPHLLLRFHQDLIDVGVVGLHVFSRAIFFVGMEQNDDVAPAGTGFLRDQDAAVGHRVDRIAQVAVFTADAIEIVAEMAILGERLRVVSQRAVFASDGEVESLRRGQRDQKERRHNLERRIDRSRSMEFRPEPEEKAGCEGEKVQAGQDRGPALRRCSSFARRFLHLYARAMRILVTGGAGFIGSHLVEKLLTTGHDVSVLDDFNDFYDPQIKLANIAAIAGEVPIHRIDLRDNAAVDLLFHREKFDAIAHLAARAGVRPSISQPQLYYDTNVSGTLHLLEAARQTGIERFIFASSSSVYGICKTVPFSEDEHLTQTISPYAATKVAGEFLCSTYSHLYQMRIVALRFFTVYGARQRPDLAIHQFTRKINAGEPIDQFGDGTTRRDYTYIDDIIQGVMAAFDYKGPLYDPFNLGESETIQLKDLISEIEKTLGKKAKINQLPEQPGDVPLTCADISKARKLLNYNPTTPLSVGLPKFVDWFLSCSRER